MQKAALAEACAGRHLAMCAGQGNFTRAKWVSHFSIVSTV